MAVTVHVRGHKVTTRSPRRYLVVAVRPEPVTDPEHGTYVAFAEIRKRTDSHTVAKNTARRLGRFNGGFHVVVDTVTKEEV